MRAEARLELDKKTLDQLIELMQRDGLDRLRVKVEGIDVDLRMSVEHARPPQIQVDQAVEHARPPQELAADEVPANVRKVLAPLVGMFYRAPAPGAKRFVELGDAVATGQTLCILEAMKLMNEIVSDHDGKVVKVLPKDGELVALHQELFWIET